MGEPVPPRQERRRLILRPLPQLIQLGSPVFVDVLPPEPATIVDLRPCFNGRPGALVRLESGATLTVELSVLRDGYYTEGHA